MRSLSGSLLCLFLLLASLPLWSFSAAAAPASAKDKGTMLLTVLMRHDQSKTLLQIGEHLKRTGFWRHFPPKGVKVVSWNIVMGIGHVITLRLPPERLRSVNVVLEKRAWGGFRTEFYPTYHFLPIWKKTYQVSKTAKSNKAPAKKGDGSAPKRGKARVKPALQGKTPPPARR